MLVSRTPYRISMFGGGTDYAAYYRQYGGAVLSTTINKYCYLTCRFLPPFFKEKSRIIWSKIESVADNGEIEHQAVRACLKYLNITQGIEIHHTGDLPARSGLGSSSSFTVGLLKALIAMTSNRQINGYCLATEAVHVERDILKENVGVQDQIAVACGGFNKITIQPNGVFTVAPVIIPKERLAALQSHFLLFYTGVSRTASDIVKNQQLSDKNGELAAMSRLLKEVCNLLTSNDDIAEFGRLLHEGWQIKRSLAANISPGFVDDIYARAKSAGAIGGKLLGAGGGGFMLFFARPDDHARIKKALENLLWVPFAFENDGSQIIFNAPDSYSSMSLVRRDYYHLQV